MRRVLPGRCIPVAVAILGAAVLQGCSSSMLSAPAANFSSFFASASTTATGTTPAGTTPDFECPSINVRSGTSTLTISANASEDSAMNLRYQAGLGQTARECKLNGQTLTMRVGLQGRIILGPAGGPGEIELPIRLAVVHEGPEPKTIYTKLNRVPVTIPSGDGNIQFTTIEEDLTFPMPRNAGAIDEYVVYVGFDSQAMREPPKKKPPPRSSSSSPPASSPPPPPTTQYRGGPPRPAR
jgi:hypothetical protein